jgi:hypothetical protein
MVMVFCNAFLFADATKTVGASGADYATLSAAFSAINAGTLTGAVTLQIVDNTTEPTSVTNLAKSGTGSANYTSITIYPTVTGKTISQSNSGGSLVSLNGASNLTIDGRLNQTGSTPDLTIANASQSAISLSGGASGNTFRYCTLKGSYGYALAGGVIDIQGGPCSNNLFEYNNITNGGTRPVTAIYSKGGSVPNANAGNIVRYNQFYDLFGTTGGYYIKLDDYNSSWTIQQNSFYETSAIAPTQSNTYTFIYVFDSHTGTNFLISGNYLGGTAPQCGGSAFTKTNSLGSSFFGIYISTSSGAISSIQGNTISNIDWWNPDALQFIAIVVGGAGDANIGTITGNVVGAPTGNGAITYTSDVTGGQFTAIVNQTNGTVNCQNNTIGSITTANSNPANRTNVVGFQTPNGYAGTVTFSNNVLGSTITPNSLYASSASTTYNQTISVIESYGSGSSTFSGNTIANVTNNEIGRAHV